ncbi:hypothetical protein THAOC_12035, partial [Thalassiosira oceanica]
TALPAAASVAEERPPDALAAAVGRRERREGPEPQPGRGRRGGPGGPPTGKVAAGGQAAPATGAPAGRRGGRTVVLVGDAELRLEAGRHRQSLPLAAGRGRDVRVRAAVLVPASEEVISAVEVRQEAGPG